MAVPKRKTSRSKRDIRRAQQKPDMPSVASCPQCHSPKLSHRVCPVCGTYAGREVVAQEAEEQEAASEE